MYWVLLRESKPVSITYSVGKVVCARSQPEAFTVIPHVIKDLRREM